MSESWQHIDPFDRFADRLVVAANGCLLWSGMKDEFGYGRFYTGGTSSSGKRRRVLAHRWLYMRYRGQLASDQFLCHTCDNPSCVNPSHLFIGDSAANMRDMASKGSGKEQHKTHCPQGHAYEGENLMLGNGARSLHRRCRICHRETDRRSRANRSRS
jgi:hypothetical protein